MKPTGTQIAIDAVRAPAQGSFRILRWISLAALIAPIVGCGGNDLPLVPVTGKVTFNGGPSPGPGVVGFAPLEVPEGLPRRPASGRFEQDGTFVVTSFREGDGLVPGRYRVTIVCNSGLPDPSKPDPWDAVSYVPKDYQPPELIVELGSKPLEVHYDVPPRKGRGRAVASN